MTGIILVLPFFFILNADAFLFLKDRINDAITASDIVTLSAGIGVHFFIFVIYTGIILLMMGVVFFYHYMFILQLNLKYIRQENMNFWNRDFFSLSNFWKFVKMFFCIILLLFGAYILLSVSMIVGAQV